MIIIEPVQKWIMRVLYFTALCIYQSIVLCFELKPKLLEPISLFLLVCSGLLIVVNRSHQIIFSLRWFCGCLSHSRTHRWRFGRAGALRSAITSWHGSCLIWRASTLREKPIAYILDNAFAFLRFFIVIFIPIFLTIHDIPPHLTDFIHQLSLPGPFNLEQFDGICSSISQLTITPKQFWKWALIFKDLLILAVLSRLFWRSRGRLIDLLLDFQARHLYSLLNTKYLLSLSLLNHTIILQILIEIILLHWNIFLHLRRRYWPGVLFADTDYLIKAISQSHMGAAILLAAVLIWCFAICFCAIGYFIIFLF